MKKYNWDKICMWILAIGGFCFCLWLGSLIPFYPEVWMTLAGGMYLAALRDYHLERKKDWVNQKGHNELDLYLFGKKGRKI